MDPMLAARFDCGSGVAARHPDRGRRQDDGDGVGAEDHNGSARPQESRRMVDSDGGLERSRRRSLRDLSSPDHAVSAWRISTAGRRAEMEWFAGYNRRSPPLTPPSFK
jgi:hypothetical protein